MWVAITPALLQQIAITPYTVLSQIPGAQLSPNLSVPSCPLTLATSATNNANATTTMPALQPQVAEQENRNSTGGSSANPGSNTGGSSGLRSGGDGDPSSSRTASAGVGKGVSQQARIAAAPPCLDEVLFLLEDYNEIITCKVQWRCAVCCKVTTIHTGIKRHLRV